MTGKPRRPMSAYMLWLNSVRDELKAQNPGCTITQIARKGGEMWRAMKDKQIWNERAKEAKEQYERELAEYTKSMAGKSCGDSGDTMKPREAYSNGSDGGDSDSDSESGSESGDPELWVEDREAPARALAALNALRKSRQHYDVVLVAGGAEVPAHRALLAAASPYLLQALGAPSSPAGPPTPAAPPGSPHGASAPVSPPPDTAAPNYRVEGIEADALKELVEYMYTGCVRAADGEAARRLYVGAWRLRLEAARAQLAERLVRRLAVTDCLHTRALPDLPAQHIQMLDKYIAEHFDELCSSGALTALPLIRMELLRASSADGGEEAPAAVAEAALTWLRDHNTATSLPELCSRAHLVYVDGRGELRDCGELPAAQGDAPELQEYRRAAQERPLKRSPAGWGGSGGAEGAGPTMHPRPLPGLELGARAPRPHCAVLAARGAAHTPQGGCRVTRALFSLHGQLVAAQIAWRDVGGEASGGSGGVSGGGTVAVGGPLGGARDEGGAKRAQLAVGRCAHGGGVIGSRLIVCGGYDRSRVLRAAEAYSPGPNEWAALPDMRTARARFPAAQLHNRLYVLGGSDGHNELDSLDVYDQDTNTWSSKSKLPLAVSHAAAASDPPRSAIYVVGGWAGGRSLRRVHKYHPLTDMWSDAPSLNTGRSQCASVVWEDYLWALGGCDAWHCLNSTERLPLGSEGAQWEPGVALPTARRSMGGCVWADKLVSAGGSDGANSLRRVDWLQANHVSEGWKAGPELRRARAALTLHVLEGVLYAVGGFDGKEFLSCVECLYQPDGEWTSLCAPPPLRAPLPTANTAAASDTKVAPQQPTPGHTDNQHSDTHNGNHTADTQVQEQRLENGGSESVSARAAQ